MKSIKSRLALRMCFLPFLLVVLNSTSLVAFQPSSITKLSIIQKSSSIIHSNRRDFLKTGLGIATSTLGLISLTSEEASALQQAYPTELQMVKDGNDIETLRKEYIANKKREINEKRSLKNFVNGFDDNESLSEKKVDTNVNTITSVVWGGALWLLSGSRQNALVNPMANLLFNAEEEEWLRDRNEGLFAPLPPGFQIILGATFLMIGFIVDRILLFAVEGDSAICLQLAGVAAINGAFFELGRIASGEKDKSREESDREALLEEEFNEFAANRIIAGGNCHRNEVVVAFRRYFSKYRTDNESYPLTDLEIERLLKNWNRRVGNEEMSSAGFFSGIQISDKVKEAF